MTRCTCGDCALCEGVQFDLVAVLERVVGHPLPPVPRGGCCDDEPCVRCVAGIERAEEARDGWYAGWSEREVADLGDALAAGDWAGRGGAA